MQDTQGSQDRPSPAGGVVEPASRDRAPRDRPPAGSSERYELRDPFSEVTYRARSEREIVAKADELGSLRYVAVDPAGRRTIVEKVDGEWQRGRPSGLAPPVVNVRSEPLQNPPPPEIADQPSTAPSVAERTQRREQLEAALLERYIVKRAPMSLGDVTIGQTEYRFRGDVSRIAFTASTLRLATDTNSPSVVRSMVDVAEARHWTAVRVSGHEDFRRMVWLEASTRGLKTLGYEPNLGDVDLLRRAGAGRLATHVEPATHRSVPESTPAGRGDGGRKAVLAAIEAVLIAKLVPEPKRQAVMAAAAEKLTQRMREGQAFQVKVYDRSAPTQRTAIAPRREPHRVRAQPAPVR